MEIRAAVGARDEPERLRQLTRGEQPDTADRPPRYRSTRGQAVLTLVVAIVVVQHPPRDARRAGAALGRHALDSEQALLQPHPVRGIPDQVAARPDDAVAGYDDGHRVVTKRLRHGAHSPWRPDLAGEAGVRGHSAVWHGRRRLEHRTVERAPREPQVERPLEPGTPALDVLEQVSVQPLDLGTVLERLDGLVAAQPRMGEVAAAGEILDARYALLGPRDQNGAERRGKDPVEERPADLAQGLEHVGPRAVRGAVEAPPDGVVVEVVDLSKGECKTLLERQPGDDGVEHGPGLLEQRLALGPRAVGLAPGFQHRGVGPAATGLGSEVVLRDVARDGKEPGAPVRVRGKGPVGAVGAQEGLLGEIVRLAGPEGGP